MTANPTRPRLWQSALAIVVITGAAFVIVYYAALFVKGLDPLAAGGVIFFGVPCYCAIKWQYRGTFQCDPKAARRLGWLFYILGGFCLFGYVANVSEHIQEHGWGADPTAIFIELSKILIPAGVGLVLGFVNHIRARRLDAIYREHSELQPRKHVTLRELLGGITILAVVFALVVTNLRSLPPQFAEHVNATTAQLSLPAGAADISYYRGSRGTIAYEFTTDEQVFRRWVEAGIGSIESDLSQAKLEEIVGFYGIARYRSVQPGVQDDERAMIGDGLKYEWKFKDRGVFAAYDRKTGRAYYYAHFH